MTRRRATVTGLTLAILCGSAPPSTLGVEKDPVRTAIALDLREPGASTTPRDTRAPGGEPGTQGEVEAYALREAASPQLEEFSGGFHGAVLLVALLVTLVVLVAVLLPW